MLLYIYIQNSHKYSNLVGTGLVHSQSDAVDEDDGHTGALKPRVGGVVVVHFDGGFVVNLWCIMVHFWCNYERF